ncbi:MAG: hypothetical protein NVSMB10_01920 [Steroidobacteraceae bacterium]
MEELRGVGILVTRPRHQAIALGRLFEGAGARITSLPAIDIEAAGRPEEWKHRLGDLGAFDLIIFTSANAVHYGAPLLDPARPAQLAAIGPATARALASKGFPVTSVPTGTYDSESLLSLPALAQPNGRRVLIVKGLHGRPFLQDELARHGARVVAAEVYKRVPMQHGPAVLDDVERRITGGHLHVLTATSVQIASCLVDMAPPPLRQAFDRIRWLVPSERVGFAVRARGITAPILHAATAADQDLVAAVIRWRSSESGA